MTGRNGAVSIFWAFFLATVSIAAKRVVAWIPIGRFVSTMFSSPASARACLIVSERENLILLHRPQERLPQQRQLERARPNLTESASAWTA